MPLRIALVHSYYDSRQPSGENTQVDAERDALARAGLEVRVFGARTDERGRERFYRTRAAARVATHRGTSPLAAIERFAPDVVHVHNLFPNFGRRWVEELDVPVVVSLHNFRFVCAAATLFRDGRVCTDCPDGRPSAALRHRCYRGSAAATLPLVLANRGGPTGDPVIRRADRLLCIFPRQRRILEAAGVEPDRIVPWHNFLPDALAPAAADPGAREGCLYVGRLTEEKGVADLVAHWSGDMRLTVVGDGPLRTEVARLARGRNVAVLGPTPRPRVVELLRRCVALALPSLWPEVMPLTAIEALACGVPVIARADTASAQPVLEDAVGQVVPDAASFAAAATRLAGDPTVAERCRAVFESRYTQVGWVRRITDLYGGLVRTAGTG